MKDFLHKASATAVIWWLYGFGATTGVLAAISFNHCISNMAHSIYTYFL